MKPRYPQAEAATAAFVKERRAIHKAVSKDLVVRELAKEAKKEKPASFPNHPISDDIFFGFLRRHGFSFRIPSNVKSLAKKEAVRRVRGFWQWLITLLDGAIPVALGSTDFIHPKWGRFPPSCRRNKDEVPGRFGDTAAIISHTGESSTVMRVIEGWGDRFSTYILCGGPGGLDLPVGVVFKGTGQKLKAEELDYYKSLPNIVVFFQENAWVDTSIELKVVEKMITPIAAKIKKTFTEQQEGFPGILLIEDNFKPHFAEYSSLHFTDLSYPVDVCIC
jgi:hypothetical protein